MKQTASIRRTFAGAVALAFIVLASNSFAALNAYLTLKGSNGKTYKCALDQNGTFTFSNVAPGSYTLILVSDDGSASALDAASKEAAKIEISSFSWGASNPASSGMSGTISTGHVSKSTQVTRSNISNNRVSSSSSSGSPSVAVGDLNGDGVPDVITSPVSVSLSSAARTGMTYQWTLIQNVVVTSACSPSGTYKTSGWNLKENVK